MSLEAIKISTSEYIYNSFNPYFVGSESGRIDGETSEHSKESFNPYFVGSESGSLFILILATGRAEVSILILLEVSLEVAL